MIVVDASALLEVLVVGNPDRALLMRLAGEELHAPHLIDVEVLHSLRVLATRKAATTERIETGRAEFLALGITRYAHIALRERIWELRHNLSAYDAAYVALAEGLEVPLITVDSNLRDLPRVRAEIEVFHRADDRV